MATGCRALSAELFSTGLAVGTLFAVPALCMLLSTDHHADHAGQDGQPLLEA